MIKRASDQISIVDVTDAYSVTLSSYAHIFAGTTDAAIPGSTTIHVIAARGTELIPAYVDAISTAEGLSCEVLSNDTANVRVKFSVVDTFKQDSTVELKIYLEDRSVVMSKYFSISVAFSGTDGTPGTPGEDAITLNVNSSRGTIFKDQHIITTLSAHVYQGGKELSEQQIPDIGEIRWYKNQEAAPSYTGSILDIPDGVITDRVHYTLKLQKTDDNSVISQTEITLSATVDIKSTTRYYLLNPASSEAPAKPNTNPPSGSWSDTEPPYTEGSTNHLYFVDLTVFSDGSWSYSSVSLSSTYEAARSAWLKAQGAQESIDQLQIGGTNLIQTLSDQMIELHSATVNRTPEAEKQNLCGYRIELSPFGAEEYGGVRFLTDLSLTAGTYTLSFDGWSRGTDVPVTVRCNLFYEDPFVDNYFYDFTPEEDKIQRYSAPVTVLNDQTVHLRILVFTKFQTGTIYLSNVKMEQGTRATGWSPNPTDQKNYVKQTGEDIQNGTAGIFFKNSTVGEVTINNTVGVKITGNDGTYFQAKNDAMGFFDNAGQGLMYYENGNMYLKGYISALGGFIGGENGWVIGNQCIYNNNAETLEAPGGIYLGSDGISIGTAIVMKPDGTFIIRSDNADLSANNYVFKIEPVTTADGNIIYNFLLNNITFDDSFILPLKNGGTGSRDKATAGKNLGIFRVKSTDSMNDLKEATNGDLCVLYSEGAAGISVNGAITTSPITQPGFLTIGKYNDPGHQDQYFDITEIKYWNIYGLSGETVNTMYSRVGAGYTSSASGGLFVPIALSVTGAATTVSSISMNFTINTFPEGAGRDTIGKIENAISVNIYRGDSGERVASTTYMVDSAWVKPRDEERAARITMTSPVGFSSGEYYVVFFTRNKYSLLWIKQMSVSVVPTSTQAESGIYVKSNDVWNQLASSVIPPPVA